MGFVSPVATISMPSASTKDPRGNAKAGTEAAGGYKTNVDKVFAAGDMRRGQIQRIRAMTTHSVRQQPRRSQRLEAMRS